MQLSLSLASILAVATGSLVVASGAPAPRQQTGAAVSQQRVPPRRFQLVSVDGRPLPAPFNTGGAEPEGTRRYLTQGELTITRPDSVMVRLELALGICEPEAHSTEEPCPLMEPTHVLGGPLGLEQAGDTLVLRWPEPAGGRWEPPPARGILAGDSLRLTFPARRAYGDGRPDSTWVVPMVFVRVIGEQT